MNPARISPGQRGTGLVPDIERSPVYDRSNRIHTCLPTLLLGGVLVFAGMLLPGVGNIIPAQAQVDNRDGVVNFIDQTGELLDWAGDIVHESGNLQARRVLGEAMRLHERSLHLVDQGRPDPAMPVARRARAATYHAVRLARESLIFSERFQIMDERYADRRRTLQDKARTSGNEQALDLLGRAENQSLRAREQYHQGDAKRACRMLEQVEMIQNRAGRLLGVGPGPGRLEEQLERTAALIESAHEMLGPDPGPARNALLHDAEAALAKAREFRDRGQPQRALQLGGVARRLVDQALAGPGDDLAPGEAARRQIDRWDGRAMRIRIDHAAPPERRVDELFRKAGDHRRRAAVLLDEGKPLMALRQIKLAHDLLDEVERRLR